MSEVDFFNLEEEAKEANPVAHANGPAPLPFPKGIIERKIHTIVTFRQYPDGRMFVTSSKSWLDKMGEQVTTKPKKQPIKAKETKLQPAEEH